MMLMFWMLLVGPFSALSRVKPKLNILFISPTEKKIVDQPVFPFPITATHTFRELNPDQIDVIVVTGGSFRMGDVLTNTDFLGWLNRVSEKAKWVTSVCAGAFILAAAGELIDHKATSHWVFIPLLEKLKEKGLVSEVIKWHEREPNPRYVLDGNRISSAGVSSGIDSTLAWVNLEYGRDDAREKDLQIQYRTIGEKEMEFVRGAGDLSTIEAHLLEKAKQGVQHWVDTIRDIIDNL